MQFDYLVKHGLRPADRILEIGCGNLRAGRLLIDYLDDRELLRYRYLGDVLYRGPEHVLSDGQGCRTSCPGSR